MLNRRLLRVKAMQAVYAFKQAENSDLEVAKDLITEILHQPVMLEGQDIKIAEGNKKMALLVFEESVPKGIVAAGEDIPTEVRKAITEGLNYFKNQQRKDRANIGKTMVSDLESLYDQYLKLLLLAPALADFVLYEEEENSKKHLPPPPSAPHLLKFAHNPLVEALRQHQGLDKERIRRGIGWQTENSFIKLFYRDILKNDEQYIAYREAPEVTPEEHQRIVRHIIKNLVFKHELSVAYFEEADLKWAENKSILSGMLLKTLKALGEENDQEVELIPISPDWEDDKEFFIKLYQQTIESEKEADELIVQKVQKWDLSRIALIDRIIIHMAMTEMLHFSSIPVKVTINEYIELAKVYSTPQSKLFINGVLDALASELTSQGLIKKSGRGLIDSK